MNYFEKLLCTLEIMYCAHAFDDVNDNIIRDVLLLAEKNKSKLIYNVDCDVELYMASIIFDRLKNDILNVEREVVLFERLFNSICKVING